MRTDTPSPSWYEPLDDDDVEIVEHVGDPEPLVIRAGWVTWRSVTDDD